MQQDKSAVFEGLVKIHLMVFHVSGRAVLIRTGSIGESERKRGNWAEEEKRGRREKCGG